jgi:hypothetical protein
MENHFYYLDSGKEEMRILRSRSPLNTNNLLSNPSNFETIKLSTTHKGCNTLKHADGSTINEHENLMNLKKEHKHSQMKIENISFDKDFKISFQRYDSNKPSSSQNIKDLRKNFSKDKSPLPKKVTNMSLNPPEMPQKKKK